MNSARLAIITRTKNRPALLARAVASVLAQSFEDFLHVVVNDGGDPAQLEAVLAPHRQRYGSRLLVLNIPDSQGMEAAANAGIRASSSRFLVIHDDDDTWHPDFARRAVEALETRSIPGAQGVVTHSMRVLETLAADGTVTRLSAEPFNCWLDSVTLYRMCAGNVFPPIAFVYERDALESVGLYREDLPVLGDWEFNLRFLSAFDMLVIPEPLAFYHHRPQTDGVYGNSVFGHSDRHTLYDALIRNEYLRRDLREGRQGLGHLMNIGRSFETVHAQVGQLQGAVACLNRVADRLAGCAVGRLLSRLLGG